MSWIVIEDPFEAEATAHVDGYECTLAQASAWWGPTPCVAPYRYTFEIRTSRDVVLGLAWDIENGIPTAQPPGTYAASCGVRSSGVVLSGGLTPLRHVVAAASADEVFTVVVDLRVGGEFSFSYGVIRPPPPRDWTDNGSEPHTENPVVPLFAGKSSPVWFLVSNPDLVDTRVEMVRAVVEE